MGPMKTPVSNRRQFLRTSLAAAAGPLILPSGIRSAPVKPNDRITVGFIGMGKQSRGLMNKFVKDGRAVVVAVCDVDATRRKAEKQRADEWQENGDCRAYTDFREITSREDIDAVCIATPDHWHAIQTIAALENGQDVYCEKPLTHNIHESVAVMEATAKHGRILQTGSMQRSSREFRVACELVRNGVIGRIERCAVNIGGPAVPCDLPAEKKEPGLDWNFWLGPAPERPYHSILSPRGVHDHFPHWRKYREYGGGSVADWGAHHLDIVQWGLDEDGGGPVRVIPSDRPESGKGARLIYPGEVPVVHGPGIGVEFIGTEGKVQVNRGRFAITKDGETIGRLDRKDRTKNLGKELDKAEARYLSDAALKLAKSPGHVPDFLDSMQSRNPPITPAEVGARSAICCHLLNLAYYHGETMDWNPEANEFDGGTGKLEWLTRDYRGEWTV